ncbi:hypothetical protein HYFRA_00009686 [Hymenoscyphus fraxineus]|uniref:Glycosyltransferase family 32 protein n=1 Tax=Hymenoscyphus fraxineus TaxID=746836 RepID=A0A9N9PQY5_9HELO|nr:hypothetical protein HYFRA_00009686 [Hymenoscyphus fraxineus]
MQVTNTIFVGRPSKQIRRALPVYFACIFIALVFFNSYSGDTSSLKPSSIWKRVWPQSPLYPKTNSKFPKKIWQTWKVDPLEFDERDSGRARTWPQKNPGHRYEVLTDGNDMDYVERNFGPDGLNRLDVVYMYRTLTARIIKADLLRYLIMYVEGGVYADIDVEAVQPVDTWIQAPHDEGQVGLVISVEIDEPDWNKHKILGPKSQSFCQWTIMAKPKHPVMLRLIDNVVAWIETMANKQSKGVAEIELNFDEVLSGTGPSAFTTAVLAEMAIQVGKEPPWEKFHRLNESILIGDILVLPVQTFASNQGHSHSEDPEPIKALVRHHYHASLWPSRHPRYSHPGYGMVEECNWTPDCVHEWDKNVANWDALPQEAKDKQIAEHNKMLDEKFAQEEKERLDREKEERENKEKEQLENCAKLQIEKLKEHPLPVDNQTEIPKGDAKPAETPTLPLVLAPPPAPETNPAEPRKPATDNPRHTDAIKI